MQPEHVHQFTQLADRARSQLAAGSSWRLRLTVEPSFDPPMVLGIDQEVSRDTDVGARGLRAICRTWDRVADEDKFRSPVERLRHSRVLEPTIIERSAAISEHKLTSILLPLTEARIAVLPTTTRALVLDGVGYELLVNATTVRACYRWWSTNPAEWRELIGCFAQTWDRLAASMEGVIRADRLGSLR